MIKQFLFFQLHFILLFWGVSATALDLNCGLEFVDEDVFVFETEITDGEVYYEIQALKELDGKPLKDLMLRITDSSGLFILTPISIKDSKVDGYLSAWVLDAIPTLNKSVIAYYGNECPARVKLDLTTSHNKSGK